VVSDQRRRIAARAREVIVTFDYRTQKKAAIPSFMRERFQERLALQPSPKAKE